MTQVVARKLKAYKASQYVLKIVAEYYPHLKKASLIRISDRLSPARHSDDFRQVRWFGRDFEFTPAQAAIVDVLWRHWENGTPRVGADPLLHAADMVSDRVSHLFKGSEAWGTMIGTDSVGHYWLQKIP